MRKTQEVLRLYFELKLRQRQIARSANVSQSTVHEYVERFLGAGLSWPLPAQMSEADLERKLLESQTALLVDSVTVARRSAEAALKQTNHMLASQRPWMHVSVNEQQALVSRSADFFAVNKGHSPVKVVMFKAEKVAVSPDATNDGPRYGGDGRFDEAQWRFPEESFPIWRFPLGPDVALDAQGRNLILLQGFVR